MTTRRRRPAAAVALTVLGAGAALTLLSCSAPYQSGRRPAAASTGGIWGTGTTPWLAPQTADALSAELATALEGTRWCAGWVINVQDTYNRSSDVGSNLGTGTAAHTCDKWAEITVEVAYTSEASEADDTAGIRVDGHDAALTRSLQEHPALLDGTGYEALLADSGDDAVANAVAGLPAALAELGHIAPLAAAPAESADGTSGPDSADGAGPGGFAAPDAGGSGGSDTVTQHPLELYAGVACIALAALGLAALLVAHIAGRSSRPATAGPAPGFRPAAPPPHGGAPTTPPASSVNPRRALRAALDRQTAAPRS